MQAMLQTTSKFCLASILLIPECHENPRPTRIFFQLFGTKTDKGCENSTVAKVGLLIVYSAIAGTAGVAWLAKFKMMPCVSRSFVISHLQLLHSGCLLHCIECM